MTTKNLILFVPGILIMALSSAQTKEEKHCLDPKYHEKCFYAAKSILNDYIYLKSRPFSREMDSLLFSVSFKKNTLYLFNLCEGSESNAIINIFDPVNEEVPIASTYDPVARRNTRLLSFYAKSNGKYLISVTFGKSERRCVVVVCGMIRKNIETYIKIPD